MTIKLRELRRDGEHVAVTINKACSSLGDGDTLLLDNTEYHIYKDGIFTKYYHISNNDKGDKPILFPLMGKRNITIDGNGARLIFHDGVIPFSIDGCENVTIKNFTINATRLQFAQAEIVEADREHTVLKFDGKEFFCRVEQNKVCFSGVEPDSESKHERALCLEFDKEKRTPSAYLPAYFFYSGEPRDHGFLRNMFRDVEPRSIGENLIELRGDLGFTHTVGNMWCCTYGNRTYPGVFANNSKNVTIENMTLHHVPAMGVIAQLCENITLDNVRACVEAGSERMISVKADATHFVNCRGKITIKDCKFVNMMDDAVNIHGIYLRSPEKIGAHTIKTTLAHHQQAGINIFKPGDVIRVIDTDTVKETARYTVKESVLSSETELTITTAEEVADIMGDCVAENVTTAPEVHITNTESGNNRPRGFLLSSAGKTLVENCKFYNMRAALSIGGEMKDWYESSDVCDVTVRDNDFANSAYTGGPAIAIVPRVKDRTSAGSLHGKIVIENNRFTMHEKRLLHASNVGELVFKGNKFTKDETLPAQTEVSGNGVRVEYCGMVTIDRENEDM